MKKVFSLFVGSILMAGFLMSFNSRNQMDADSAAAAPNSEATAVNVATDAKDFYNSLPDPSKIVWDESAGSYLKTLGFKGTTETTFNGEEDETSGTYTLKMGERECIVSFKSLSNYGTTDITIKGDREALEKYYQRALKLARSYEDEETDGESGTEVTKEGDTITILSYGA